MERFRSGPKPTTPLIQVQIIFNMIVALEPQSLQASYITNIFNPSASIPVTPAASEATLAGLGSHKVDDNSAFQSNKYPIIYLPHKPHTINSIRGNSGMARLLHRSTTMPCSNHTLWSSFHIRKHCNAIVMLTKNTPSSIRYTSPTTLAALDATLAWQGSHTVQPPCHVPITHSGHHSM